MDSLLSKELRRKSLETFALTLGSHILVSEEGRGRSRNNSTSKRDKNRGRSKPMKDLKCYYCDFGYIKKGCWKLKKDQKENDNKGQDNQDVNVVYDELVIVFYTMGKIVWLLILMLVGWLTWVQLCIQLQSEIYLLPTRLQT